VPIAAPEHQAALELLDGTGADLHRAGQVAQRRGEGGGGEVEPTEVAREERVVGEDRPPELPEQHRVGGAGILRMVLAACALEVLHGDGGGHRLARRRRAEPLRAYSLRGNPNCARPPLARQ